MGKAIFFQPLQHLLLGLKGLKSKVAVVAQMEVLHQLSDMNFLPIWLIHNYATKLPEA